MPATLASDLPETLQRFILRACGLSSEAFHPLRGEQVPEPARKLLVHQQDMTSTLASFHESPIRVEILQSQQQEGGYLREVFLRAASTEAIVEYGVLAVALEQYSPEQRAAIVGGVAPLGALLHRFSIPFVSAPIGFFGIPSSALAGKGHPGWPGATCYGRFNRLAKPTGEPLAWILEILPPV